MSPSFAPREDLLARLLGALHCARLEHAPIIIPLASLPSEERAELDEVVGEGSRSALIRTRLTADIRDTLLPGVWRTRLFDEDGHLVADELEIAEVPHLVSAAGKAMPSAPSSDATSPTVSAMVKHVLRCALSWRPGDPNLVVPITGSAEERHDLARVLGVGPVVADSHRLGHCEQRLTHLKRVWWLRYLAPDEHIALETLEIGDAPSELRTEDPELDATERRLLASLTSPGVLP